MGKKVVKTTQSSRKHAFLSFKERVDSIKIEPTLNLNKRVYDEVEDTSSHFISTLQHWQEVNLSGNFTDFVYEVRKYSNSLPQVIYHQQKIFDSLHKHISENNPHSIQPLLELLSQFVHDLGSDYMKYYEDTLKLLTNLALEITPNELQNNINASNLLEWVFNSLTFIFKYLSKDLIQDFKSTFENLLPILTLQKKLYISRFCAEALSFLIKKMKPAQLNDVIKFLLVDNATLVTENNNFADSLIVIFAEAIKTTKEAFHSKANMIFERLINISLQNLNSNIVLSGLLSEIFQHGTSKSIAPFLDTTVAALSSSINDSKGLVIPDHLIEILITLTFSESGKKTNCWDSIISLIFLIFDSMPQSGANVDSLLYCLSITIRNCEIIVINKNFKKLMSKLIDYNDGENFIPFIDSSLEFCQSNLMKLGLANSFQEFVNNSSNDEVHRQLSYFKMKRPDFPISVPPNLAESVSNTIDLKDSEISNLIDIYWKLCLIKDSEIRLPMLDFLKGLNIDCLFICDFIGVSMNFLECNKVTSAYILDNFEKLSKSSCFISSFIEILPNCFFEKTELMEFNSILAKNLSVEDGVLRLNSMNLITKIFQHLKLPCPDFYNQIILVEQIPLTITTSKDIQLRNRSLTIQFLQLDNKDELDCEIISNYLFGSLTNRFQPCWESVFENLPKISSICDKFVWDLANRFITLNHQSQSKTYFNSDLEFMSEDSKVQLNFYDKRILTGFDHLQENFYCKYYTITNTILDFAQKSSSNLVYNDQVRELTLKTLTKVPELAESHYEDLLTLVLDEGKTESWTLKERNLLLSVFAKFKSLKSMKNHRLLYEKLLTILTSRRLDGQKLALEVLINFKVSAINKYKDNLRNLLDDTMFKDELTKFITNGDDSTIESQDLDTLMPLVLRILFGRVQGAPKSNSKASKKTAVINCLPTLNENQVTEFLKLGSEKIGFKDFSTISSEVFKLIKRINGYVTLLNELYHVLGYKFKDALSNTIEPLIYSMSVAQKYIDQSNSPEQDEDFSGHEGDTDLKIAKHIRQLGMRCMNELFRLLGDSYDWEIYFESIYHNIIKPRLEMFANENLQQTSSLLSILTSWIKIPRIGKFLLIDDLQPSRAIISLIENRKAKDPVISTVLSFSIDCLQNSIDDEAYYTLLALLIESLLKNLPEIIVSSSDNEVISKSVGVLLLLIDGEYITDDFVRNSMIGALTAAFEKPAGKIAMNDRQKILVSLTALISDCNLPFDDFLPYFNVYSCSLKFYKEKEIRLGLVDLFKVISGRFNEVGIIGDIIENMNSYNNSNFGEPDFERMLAAFKEVNENLYTKLTTIQWLPLIYSALFFINDENELVVRTNAAYLLNHYVDCFSSLSEEAEAFKYIQLFKDIILPEIRKGLKSSVESVQTEFINVLSHTIRNSKHFNDLEDMKVLLFENDDEANFFTNINHIQLHRRQRAIRRLAEFRNELRGSSISHYLLPIIENYAYNLDEKLRNIAHEAIHTLGLLIRNVTWNQFRSLIKKYTARLKNSKPERLKIDVLVVVEASRSFYHAIESRRNSLANDVLKDFPKNEDDVEAFILNDLRIGIQSVLNERNDDTIVSRVPLSEALVNLVRCLSENKIGEQLPGLLTSTCQVLRSRSEELRDAARKSLCQITKDLGAKYFKFLLQELKGALTRGSQIHVLSFTMHALLGSVQPDLEHGDLDESCHLIVDIIMEDIFGAAGQEKDAEGYTSKMKEVKHKKSFDSGELLTSNVSLNEFGNIIDPVKLLLQERISLKVQNKLDELLRRYALGLNHNQESTSRNILILSYQINTQSTEIFNEQTPDKGKFSLKPRGDSEFADHFLVKLNAKPHKTRVDFDQYVYTLQKFSFELLRASISRQQSLLTTSNMGDFVPLLERGINSSHEGLVSTSLRLLNTIIKLPFPEEINNIFKSCARKALNIIKDSPNTNGEACQSSLRFLATLIRHKSEINLKDTTVSYVLMRIQPDLEEPKTQGLAFNFLKSVVSQHLLLPEVYDLMQSVSKIMVVNHNREIRDMARSVYFQFLMEYDQGRGKLEKQFKFLVNNLGYATQSGRQSVLELVGLIVNKAGDDLLIKVSSSFFVSLANILVNDDSGRCREMASLVIQNIFKQLGDAKINILESYIVSWMDQTSNLVLLRCGLNVYKIYINEFGLEKHKELDRIALEKIKMIGEKSGNHEQESDTEIEWQLVYTTLNVFANICGKERQKVVNDSYANLWRSIIDTLLFPHSWVRLNASKLIGILLTNIDKCQFSISNYEIQTIAYRLLRQLGAPSISEELGNQAVKNLVSIAMKWQTEETKYEAIDSDKEVKYESANEFLVQRACWIIRQDTRDSVVSKKSAIKLCAMLVQIFKDDLLLTSSEEILLSLYVFQEPGNSFETELIEIATDCMQIIERKLGGTVYTETFSKVQKKINQRRQERKTKRAQMAITAPDISARRKLKKHARFREKRKHEKDENGYYHSKKKRRT